MCVESWWVGKFFDYYKSNLLIANNNTTDAPKTWLITLTLQPYKRLTNKINTIRMTTSMLLNLI